MGDWWFDDEYFPGPAIGPTFAETLGKFSEAFISWGRGFGKSFAALGWTDEAILFGDEEGRKYLGVDPARIQPVSKKPKRDSDHRLKSTNIQYGPPKTRFDNRRRKT